MKRRMPRGVRILLYALGGTGGTGVVGGLTLAGMRWRQLGELREDSPEYAADTPLFDLHIPKPAMPSMPVMPGWLIRVGVALCLLLAATIIVHWPMKAPESPEKDKRRLFTDSDREWIRECAGDRCEHRTLGIFRCHRRGTRTILGHTFTHRMELDHHYPHSKGGATVRRNLVYLCREHNNRKSARVPGAVETWLLYRARLKYFPARWRGYARIDPNPEHPDA